MRFFIISALLLSLSQNYPQTLGWFCLFSLLPIVHVLYKKQLIGPGAIDNKNYLGKEMFVFGLVFTLISTLYFLSTYPLDWLSIYNPLVSMAVIGGIWLSFGITMSIPTIIWPRLIAKIGTKSITSTALVAASTWVLLEFVRSWLITISLYGDGALFGPHHTYYSIGYSLTNLPFFKDTFAMGGIYLAGFVVILTNFLLYHLFIVIKNKHKISFDLRHLALLIIFIIAFSTLILAIIRSKQEIYAGIETTLINTNIPSGSTYLLSWRDFVSEIAPNGVSDLSDLVISPEGFQIDVLFKAPKPDSQQIFIGTTQESSGQIMYFNDIKIGQKFFTSKNILMPIGDYRLWWTDVLLNLTQDEKWMEGYLKRYAVKDDLPHYIYEDKDSNLAIAGSICSDNISPYIYTNAVKEGATVLVNIASHAPFRDSKLLSRQTRALNTARALESGRYFAVAANFDKSMIISDRGKITYSSHRNELISFGSGYIYPKTYTTPYVKFGNYILWIALIIVLYYWRKYRKTP